MCACAHQWCKTKTKTGKISHKRKKKVVYLHLSTKANDKENKRARSNSLNSREINTLHSVHGSPRDHWYAIMTYRVRSAVGLVTAWLDKQGRRSERCRSRLKSLKSISFRVREWDWCAFFFLWSASAYKCARRETEEEYMEMKRGPPRRGGACRRASRAQPTPRLIRQDPQNPAKQALYIRCG